MVYFFDSSAIVKRYVAELGSRWVIQLLDPAQGNRIYLARITGVEVVAALTRRGQSPGGVAGNIASAIRQFRLEFATLFRLVAITPRLVARPWTWQKSTPSVAMMRCNWPQRYRRISGEGCR